MSEKTTSEFMLEIASHYLMNGCDGCPFYNVTKTCDSKPINCNWMALRNYFKAEESKEESESAEPERTAKVIEHDASVNTDGCIYHRTECLCGACKKKVLSGDDYCSHCGAKLDWSE